MPRFMIAQFASWERRGERRTYVFPQNGAPYETNINNVAVEQYFYGRGDAGTEQLLSIQEDGAARIIQRINAGSQIVDDDQSALRSFALTLAARSRHTRIAVEEVLVGGVRQFLNRLTSNHLKDAFRRHYEQDPNIVFDPIRERLGIPRGTPLPPAVEKAAREFIHQSSEADFPWIEDGELSRGLAVIAEEVNAIDVGEMHSAALRRALTERPDIARFATWSWRIHREPTAHYVLGDIGPVALGATGVVHSPYALGRDMQQLLLPLSPQVLLVGDARVQGAVPHADALNRAIAEVSREYFVSSTHTDRERALQPLIGVRGSPLPQADLDTLIGEVLRDPLGKRSDGATS